MSEYQFNVWTSNMMASLVIFFVSASATPRPPTPRRTPAMRKKRCGGRHGRGGDALAAEGGKGVTWLLLLWLVGGPPQREKREGQRGSSLALTGSVSSYSDALEGHRGGRQGWGGVASRSPLQSSSPPSLACRRVTTEGGRGEVALNSPRRE